MKTAHALRVLIWLLIVCVAQPLWPTPPLGLLTMTWPLALLTLAALVLVPLTLDLMDAGAGLIAVRWLHLPAALLLVLACLSPTGVMAACLAAPWLLVTVLIATAGLGRLLRAANLAEATIALGMIYLAVGGGWTILARLGARPLDFSDAIVGATAVHFHYAGFVLPILCGLSARRLAGRSATLSCLGVSAGVPLVAAGITLSVFTATAFEALAAWFLVTACWLVAVRQLHIASRAPTDAAWLLSISAVALVVGMASALIYAWGRLAHIELLSLPLMYRVHGAVNALGFALPGVLGWHLLNATRTEHEAPVRELEEVLP